MASSTILRAGAALDFSVRIAVELLTEHSHLARCDARRTFEEIPSASVSDYAQRGLLSHQLYLTIIG